MKSYFKSKYFILGIYFLFLQFLIFFFNYRFVDFNVYFWFCNHIAVILAFAFLFKKYQFIKGVISVGLIPQLIWVVDFLLLYFLDITLFGVTSYVFDLQGFAFATTVVIHFFSTFVALAFTYKEPIKKESIYYGLAYGFLLIISTLLFTDKDYNINCVYYLCGFENLTIPFYPYYMPFIGIILLVFSGYYIQKWLR